MMKLAITPSKIMVTIKSSQTHMEATPLQLPLGYSLIMGPLELSRPPIPWIIIIPALPDTDIGEQYIVMVLSTARTTPLFRIPRLTVNTRDKG